MRGLLFIICCVSVFVCGCAMQVSSENQGLNPQAAAQAPEQAADEPALQERKIIYTANVDLVSEDLDGFRERLTSSLAGFQGFVASQHVTGRTGSQRVGIWTVRIPAKHFSAFIDQLMTWGEVESQKIQSQDVTEEFVDVESRLRNSRVEEQRLLKLLEEKTSDLEQVLLVERSLHEVREKIERMEGRKRFLSDKVDLTTITIKVREVQDYVPPQPPTLGTEIARTFHGSIRELMEVGKLLLLAAVAITPWLIPLAIVGLLIAWFFRRAQRRARLPR